MENENLLGSEEEIDIATQIRSLDEAIKNAEIELQEKGSTSSDLDFLRTKKDNLTAELYKQENS